MTNLAYQEREVFEIPHLKKTVTLQPVDTKLLNALDEFLTRIATTKKGSNRQRCEYLDTNGNRQVSTIYQWVTRELKRINKETAYSARLNMYLRAAAAVTILRSPTNAAKYENGDIIFLVDALPEARIVQEIGYIKQTVANGQQLW